MKPRLALSLFLSALGLVSAQVTAPTVGLARYRDHAVRALYGLPGNFVVAKSNFASAAALSCSTSACLLADNNRLSLLLLDGSLIASQDLDQSLPVLSLDGDRSTALAWLPASHVLLYWNGRAFTSLPLDQVAPMGTVTSLMPGERSSVSFLVTQLDRTVSRVQVSLPHGEIISSDFLPGVQGPAFEVAGQIVWLDDRGLMLQDASGRTNGPLAMAGLPPGFASLFATDLTCERMSSDWVHLFFLSRPTDWALHLTGPQPSVSVMPGLPPARSVLLAVPSQARAQ